MVFSAEFKATDQTTRITCRDWKEVWKIIRRVGSTRIVLVTGVCLTRSMTITRSYCCHGVRRMQNLIELVQGTVRRVAFAYREPSSIAFISQCSSKVERECFIGENSLLKNIKVCLSNMEMRYTYIHLYILYIKCYVLFIFGYIIYIIYYIVHINIFIILLF